MSIYGIPRKTKKGGGVGFLIRNTIKFKQRPDLSDLTANTENCFIEIKGKVILGSLYRPPNTPVFEFLSYYNKTCKKLKSEKIKSHVIGLDHNLDLLKHHQHKGTQEFLEILMENNQLPCITRPTRITPTSATLIDNIISYSGLI